MGRGSILHGVWHLSNQQSCTRPSAHRSKAGLISTETRRRHLASPFVPQPYASTYSPPHGAATVGALHSASRVSGSPTILAARTHSLNTPVLSHGTSQTTTSSDFSTISHDTPSDSDPPCLSNAYRTAGQAAALSSPDGAEYNSARAVGVHSYEVQLRYDGTLFCGWQLQPGVHTVQSAVEGALERVTGEPRSLLDVRAAGRTDSGVHATGQVVQFRSNKELELWGTCRYLNALLDPDVRAMNVARTAPDWHVVFSATGKLYHYDIDTNRFHDPTTVRFRHHHPQRLDVAAMCAAAALLVGTHDFAQFSNLDPAGRVRNPVKTLWRFDVLELEGGLRLKVHGSGFLYKMVRHMAGALLAVGRGRLQASDMAMMLEIGSSVLPGDHGRCRGYNVAPAKGLMLVSVDYPAHADITQQMYPDYPHDQYGRAFFGPLSSLSAEE